MQAEVELILLRQLATYLNLPMFLIGMDGELLFYNEPAGALLGRPFEEGARGEMGLETLSQAFGTVDESGKAVSTDELPIAIALRQRRPAHRRITFRSLNGVERTIETTAFPIDGLAGRQLGAVAIFWEAEA